MTIEILEAKKQGLLKEVNALIKVKKQLYSNMDIESAMSAEEKELDKKISVLFSDINSITIEKRKLL